MKTDTPTHTHGIRDFGIFTELADFPVNGCPAYLDEAVSAVCESGTATIVVFNTRFRIVPETIFHLLPWSLASIHDVSDDFRLTFFRVSKEMFTDSVSSLFRLSPAFIFYMRKHIAWEPAEGLIRRFKAYCDLLHYYAEHAPENCRRESIMQLLRVCYWANYAVFVNDPSSGNLKYTRKEELAFKFMCMIIEDHSPSRDVPYFADRLGVSPKYLTNLIRGVSGQSAREWIVYYTIFEIKALLRESSMDIKSIVKRINFPDQATLSRFFRRYTGMTPSDYRKRIHF